MNWNSRKVSRLSFVVIVIVVIGCGVVGNDLIVNSLKDQFVSHGIAHSEEVANSLLPMLQGPLATESAREAIVSRFQSILRQPHALVGYAVYLVDAERGRVLASSGSGRVNNAKDVTELNAWLVQSVARLQAGRLPHTWVVRDEAHGRPVVLTYFTPVMRTTSPAGPQWFLAVRSDITQFIDTMHDLHYRLSGMLLLTAGLIAAGGVFATRWIGRSYERYLEDMVRERTEQLGQAHAEMVRKARLATLGQTASMLAHEIRNPLASIKMSLSGLLSADHLRERDSRRLRIALREVDRLNEMLTDALSYVRPVKLSKEPMALDRLVDSVLRLVEPALLERGLHLRRTTCPECPGVRIDINQMEQVVLNLLKNAIEASSQGGRIDVAVSAKDDCLYFDVGNEGASILADEIDRLFEPFYTTKSQGTGLGLTLVKRVVEEHGGEVSVKSSAEAGTHVSLKLPLRTMAGEIAPAGGSEAKTLE